MQLSRLALFIFVIFAFQSCKKKTLTYVIKGTVSDQFTEGTISNIKIDLFQKIYINNTLSDNYKFIGSTVTDSEGRYSFEIARDRIYEIKLELFNDNYYEKKSVYSSSKLTTANENIFDEKLESKSWIKFFIKNNSNDPEWQLNIHKTNFKEGCIDCCGNGGQSFKGLVDTVFKCPTVGGQEVIIDYGKVGSQNQYTIRVTCEPFDTTNVFID